MKRIIIICISIITLFAFACASPDQVSKPDPNQGNHSQLPDFNVSDSARLTYCVIGFDPASYNLYIFSKESFYHYDYTEYWHGSKTGFDYFTEPVPEDSKYLVCEGSVSEETWNAIKKALTDNRFNDLPGDLDEDGIYDGGIYEIEVLDGSERYFSGGYEAGYGNGNSHKRFNNIQLTLEDAVKEYKEALENARANDNSGEDSNNYIFIDDPADENIYDYYSSDGSVFI